jgi:hypothetical protein
MRDRRSFTQSTARMNTCHRSQSFEMALTPQQVYVSICTQRRTGIVNLSTDLVKKIMRPRWFSAVLQGFAVLICALIFNLLSVDAAQAHALHPHDVPQVQTQPQGSVAHGDTTAKDGLTAVEKECSVNCCSPSHCASALVATPPPALFMGYLTDHVGMAPAKIAMSLDQATLKRPPKR